VSSAPARDLTVIVVPSSALSSRGASEKDGLLAAEKGER